MNSHTIIIIRLGVVSYIMGDRQGMTTMWSILKTCPCMDATMQLWQGTILIDTIM